MSLVRLDVSPSTKIFFSHDSLNSTQMWTKLSLLEHNTGLKMLALLAFILSLTFVLLHFPTHSDGLPVVNRRFYLEPRVFARIRWATKSRDILEAANERVG